MARDRGNKTHVKTYLCLNARGLAVNCEWRENNNRHQLIELIPYGKPISPTTIRAAKERILTRNLRRG